MAEVAFPQLFVAADASSRSGQRAYVGLTAARLILVAFAAGCGVASWRVGAGRIDVLALTAMLAFCAAVSVELHLWRSRPERNWYDGRAIAESAKTLAWRYAVAADPFPAHLPPADAARLLVQRLDSIRHGYDDPQLTPVPGSQITDWMKTQRMADYAARRAAYVEGRLRDQQRWYAEKAQANQAASRNWRITLFVLEFLGIAGALVEALVDSDVLITPVLAAVIGCAVAWLQIKQHDQLSRAYATTLADLASAEAKLELAELEPAWAAEVDDVEAAISREHTLWLASRSRP